MADEYLFFFDKNGALHEHDDTFDVIVHCESEEESNRILDLLKTGNRMQWISVKDELPNAEYGESKDVLTINSMGVMRVMNFDGGCWCYPTMEPYASAFKITHWTPLPEPPKGA